MQEQNLLVIASEYDKLLRAKDYAIVELYQKLMAQDNVIKAILMAHDGELLISMDMWETVLESSDKMTHEIINQSDGVLFKLIQESGEDAE